MVDPLLTGNAVHQDLLSLAIPMIANLRNALAELEQSLLIRGAPQADSDLPDKELFSAPFLDRSPHSNRSTIQQRSHGITPSENIAARLMLTIALNQ